jgi:hypothetical protein
VCLAAICNAIMDKTTHHFYGSIFANVSRYNKKWWNSSKSWRNQYVGGDIKKGRVKMKLLGITFVKPIQLTDAWHFFKMLMVMFFGLAILAIITLPGEWKWFHYIITFIVCMLSWKISFDYCYSRLFKR